MWAGCHFRNIRQTQKTLNLCLSASTKDRREKNFIWYTFLFFVTLWSPMWSSASVICWINLSFHRGLNCHFRKSAALCSIIIQSLSLYNCGACMQPKPLQKIILPSLHTKFLVGLGPWVHHKVMMPLLMPTTPRRHHQNLHCCGCWYV